MCRCGSILWLTRSVHCHHCSLPPRQAWGLRDAQGTGALGAAEVDRSRLSLTPGRPLGDGGALGPPAGRSDPVAGSRSGGALGSGGAVGSCGWIPLGGGPWVPAGRMIQSLDSAPALWFDSLADCVSPLSPLSSARCSTAVVLILWLSCSVHCHHSVPDQLDGSTGPTH